MSAPLARLYYHERAPDPRWLAECEAIAPRGTGLSWLLPVWEPGDTWNPVQRWVIWQMWPDGRIPAWAEGALDGPSPRATGHACYTGGPCHCAVKGECWVGGPPATRGIDRLTYALYKRTGCYGMRWWIVQGDRGGHRRSLTHIEQAVAQAYDLPTDPPAPGDLPYAEPDQRTWGLIRQQDKIETVGRYLSMATRHALEDLAIQDRIAAEDSARVISTYLDSQFGEGIDRLWHAFRQTTDADIVRTPVSELRDKTLDPDIEQERFIHTFVEEHV